MTKDIINKDVAVIEKKLSPMLKSAQDLEIVDEASKAQATVLLSNINKYGDAAEAEKEKVMRPALDTVNAIRAQWKPIETVVSNAVLIIRRKMTDYQTAAKKAADEEQQKIAARVGSGKGKFSVETAVKKIENIEQPKAHVSTDAGSIKFKTVKKFEVMDMTMLPIEYHLANEVAIRKAMSEGKELAGIRYFTEEVPLNYRG